MIADIYQLSPMQKGMLFQSLFEPGNDLFFNQLTGTIRGELEPHRLREAWQRMLQRHTVLRTSFHWEGMENPVQVVRKTVGFPWFFEDWRQLSREDQDRSWQRLLQRDRAKGFALDQAPLVRFHLVRTDREAYRFCWSLHHLILDGWCLSIILHELFGFYLDLVKGRNWRPQPAVPYKHYIQWLEKQDMAEAERFWRQELAGFTTPHQVVPGLSHKTISSLDAEHQHYREDELDERLTATLRHLVQRHRLTLSTLVQAVWAMQLRYYSGERDLLFGSTVSGRPAELPGVESMLGMFINTLPTRVKLPARSALIPWLQALRAAQTKRERYAYRTQTDIQKWSEVPPHQPLYESLVIVQNYPLDLSRLQDPDLPTLGNFEFAEPNNHAVTWIVTPGPRILIQLHYDDRQVKQPARIMSHFQSLLSAIAENAHRTIDTLPMLSEQEKRLILDICSGPNVPLPGDRTLLDTITAQAKAHPHRVALIQENRFVTLDRLEARANRMAHLLLRQFNLKPDDRVAIFCQRGIDMVAAILAIWKAGAAYLPLDPRYPWERSRTMIQDAEPALVLVQDDVLEPRTRLEMEALTAVAGLRELRQGCREEPADHPPAPPLPPHLAYVIYTSGSSGKPKGAMVEHLGMANHVAAKIEDLSIGPRTVLAQNASHCFDISVWQFFSALAAGGRTVVYGNHLVLDPAAFVRRARADAVTILEVVPSYLTALLDQIPPREAQHSFRHLQFLIVTGETVKPSLVSLWFGRFPQIPMVNAYGPTEASDDVTHFIMSGPPKTEIVPIGRPLRNFAIYILDEAMNLCPPGVRGEICIAGAAVGRGYLHDREKTAAAFGKNPFGPEPSTRLYKTGDLGCLDEDGLIYFLGRKDFQVKIRGFRIELEEIERGLTRLEGVRDAVVLAREDMGPHPTLCAYVQADAAACPTIESLAGELRKTLPDYMVPAALVFVERWPLTPNGKTKREALPLPADLDRVAHSQEYHPPRDAKQKALAAIWAGVLGLERVGIHDSFFALGGDSILAMRVVSLARREGLSITPQQLFQQPTVAGLAATASRARGSKAEGGILEGVLPLSPIQHHFFASGQRDLHHDNQSLLLETPPDLDFATLQRALRTLVELHDSLRLRFERKDGDWRQSYAGMPVTPILRRHDLFPLEPEQRRAELERCAADFQSELDLDEGLLLKAHYFDYGAGTASRLLLVIHHLGVDGVSWSILLDDLRDLYQAYSVGGAWAPREKTTSYRQWTKKLESLAQSAEMVRELDFWSAMATLPASRLDMNREADTLANIVATTRQQRLSLDASLTASLTGPAATAHRARPEELLLTALALALADWQDNPTPWLDLERHGREPLFEDVDLGRGTGWFTALFPIAFECSRAQDPRDRLLETLKLVKQRLRTIPHNGIGFGILRYLCEDREIRARMEAIPRPAILFNFLGHADHLFEEGKGWKRALEDPGRERSPNRLRDHLLEVNAVIVDECLELTLDYSRKFHQTDAIRLLLQQLKGYLVPLAGAHEWEPGRALTPSDFPEAGLSQPELDTLLARFDTGAEQPALIDDLYALSPMQQGMLFHTLYSHQSAAYYNQLSCTITGDLELRLFRAAWQRVVDHNDELRASFHWEQLTHPVQAIHREVELVWQEIHWDDLPAARMEARWQAFLAEERQRRYRLDQAPLMRFSVSRTGVQTHRFCWNQHHLLLDGWGSAIILKQVFDTYQALRDGREPLLERQPSFRDYIAWLRERDPAEAESFWREELAGFTAPTPLPLDAGQPRQPPSKFDYRDQHMRLAEPATTRLRAFSQAHGLTVNSICQGAWSLLLSRYSGEPEVVHGAIVSGRPAELAGADSMLGVFINALPLRTRFDEDTTLIPWLKHLQDRQPRREQYAWSSLIDIRGWSDLAPGTALFESIVIFENYPIDDALRQNVGGLEIRDIVSYEPNNYPLTVVFTPGKRELGIRAMYDGTRFQADALKRLLPHLGNLLESMLRNPHERVTRLPMLSQEEQRQILVDWNSTDAPLSREMTPLRRLENHARSIPDRIAYQWGDSFLSYARLERNAASLAASVRARLAIEPDDRVALLQRRSPEMATAMLAIWKCRAAYVPLDMDQPGKRLQTIVEDSGAKLIITEEALISRVAAFSDLPLLTVPRWKQIEEDDAHRTAEPVATASALGNLAYVIYTSGSTGKPKGAMVEQRGMTNHIQAMIEDLSLRENAVVGQTASHCFDISLWQFFAGLVCRGRTVIFSKPLIMRPLDLMVEVARKAVSHLQFVPSYLTLVLDDLGRASQIHLASLAFMVTIGETLKKEVVRRWFELFPAIPLMNAYGPTEASDSITHHGMAEPPALPSIPIGRPIRNMRIYVADPFMNLCPVGVKGEILVAGSGVGRGYLNDPERTRTAFSQNPFDPSFPERVYHTGDMGCFSEDGTLLFFGRRDHQVKIRGHRIELGEIEAALIRMDGIREAVVVEGRGDSGFLHGYLTLEGGAQRTISSIRLELAEYLPDYMVPERVSVLEAWPVTPGGKIDRVALQTRALEPCAPDDSPAKTMARTETEETLAAIWSEVLGVDTPDVHARFFDLGGHSLKAIRVVSRIHQLMGVEVSFAELFGLETIHLLAGHIEQRGEGSGFEAIEPVPLRADYEVSHAQRRIWLASQLPGASEAYHIPGAFLLRGELDAAALELAIHRLIERHESLRTVFALKTGEIKQIILEPEHSGFRLERRDLRGAAKPRTEPEALARAFCSEPLDLARGPLVRAALFRLEDDRYLLLFVIHHIIGDFWSIMIMIEEIMLLYVAFREDTASSLPDPRIQYKDYAAWHQRLIHSSAFQQHRAFWRQQLAGDLPRMQLPYDNEGGRGSGLEGTDLRLVLDEDTSTALSSLLPTFQASRYHLLVAAIYVLLYRYTNQGDLIVGTQVSGREHRDLENQIGCFLNTLVLRQHIDADDSIAAVIHKTVKNVRRAWRHQSYPFDLLIQEMGIRTQRDRHPIFDVQIDYVSELDSNRKASEAFRRTGIEVTDILLKNRNTKYDLTFLISDFPQGLEINLTYHAGLFQAKTMEAFKDRLHKVIRAMVERPERKIGEIALIERPKINPAQKKISVSLNL